MITQAIEKVIDLSRPVELNFDDRDYTSKQIYPVKAPEPGALHRPHPIWIDRLHHD